jgi:hypothetical protein
MKIGIDVQYPSVGLQIFDSLYAWDQSRSTVPAMKSTLQIKESIDGDEDLKIFFSYMPEDLDGYNLDNYDIIIFCNGGESLDIATGVIADNIHRANAYFLTNSYVGPTHQLKEKVICYIPSIPLCRDYWNRPFYPQMYMHSKFKQLPRDQFMIGINGQNKSWRVQAFEFMQQAVPDLYVRSSLDPTGAIMALTGAIFKTDEDEQYRNYVNKKYNAVMRDPDSPDPYYDNSVTIGVEDRFGKVPPGYFMLEEYYRYKCIIFPQRMWMNDEVAMTEKELKCFYAKTMPFIFGGGNTSTLMSELGWYTAWDLLPKELQEYDTDFNHERRYQRQAQALAWLHHHPEVFDSTECQTMIQHNYEKFLEGGPGIDLDRLCQVLGIPT